MNCLEADKMIAIQFRGHRMLRLTRIFDTGFALEKQLWKTDKGKGANLSVTF